MWWSERRAFCLAALAALSGCGFRPLYGTGSPARRAAGRVAIGEIVADDDAAYLLRERLVAALGAAQAPSHVLDVTLDIDVEGVALTLNNVTTRFRAGAEAEYVLRAVDGTEAARGRAQSLTGFSAPASRTASAYAARVARADARARLTGAIAEQIVQDLALSAGDWAA